MHKNTSLQTIEQAPCKAQFFAPVSESQLQKMTLGQFYTIKSPFKHQAFLHWAQQFDTSETILEPFAGANDIIKHLREIGLAKSYASFDISPGHDDVIKRNTIEDFPAGFKVGITNPPYLAMASLRNKKMSWECLKGHEDLYILCTDIMLKHLDFVAAIIPESFITRNVQRDRLQACISLTENLFEDTATPVCLALWGPKKQDDFVVWSGNKKLGSYKELQKCLPPRSKNKKLLKFNDPNGAIGLLGIDNSEEQSIKFVPGELIKPSTVSVSSRHNTRISFTCDMTQQVISNIIDSSNSALNEFRKNTGDVFLTPFKNLRLDGLYRRRLDFALARDFLAQSYEQTSHTPHHPSSSLS